MGLGMGMGGSAGVLTPQLTQWLMQQAGRINNASVNARLDAGEYIPNLNGALNAALSPQQTTDLLNQYQSQFMPVSGNGIGYGGNSGGITGGNSLNAFSQMFGKGNLYPSLQPQQPPSFASQFPNLQVTPNGVTQGAAASFPSAPAAAAATPVNVGPARAIAHIM